MNRRRMRSSISAPWILAAGLLVPAALPAQVGSDTYHRHSNMIVQRGTQALMLCNGLFVSNRTVDQIYDQELRLNEMPVVPLEQVAIDKELRTVSVGVMKHEMGGEGMQHEGMQHEGGPRGGHMPIMRAAYREGLGCIVMGPEQTLEDVGELPGLTMEPAGGPETMAWPEGDVIVSKRLPRYVDRFALEAAADWAFDRETHGHPSQITLGLLVVHKGDILLERYAPGVDFRTRTRTWSTAKSIASTLIGIAVGKGMLSLDEPLPWDEWAPSKRYVPEGFDVAAADPRRRITLRHVLNMSSGLYPVDNELCRVIGSCLSYFAGASSALGAVDRGLVAEPGTVWDYENYDTLLGVLALKTAIGDDQGYLEFPRRELFDKIGMRSTLPGVDRFGDFVMSSQIYMNARDLARLGMLYLNDGVWNGERILPSEWIEFVRTPAPSTASTGNYYGGQWWLPPDDRTDVPQDAYTTAGNRGQYTIVVPSHDLVIVRRGLDWMPGRHGFDEWDLMVEVLKAFPDWPAGAKLVAGAP